MAARAVKSASFDPTSVPMDRLPSSTLKRHPKMDLNKNDLLRLLSYLEGELQGRDITIAALKAEKAKQLLYQAKYGRFGLGDPFHALQRDSDSQGDASFNESAVKAMYDNQLLQLENLIETQRRAQHRMREQLVAVEKRYHKACAELEVEKQKHAQDTAQGDDVTYMLEKDRERLIKELEFEKNQNKKIEKDGKRTTAALDSEKTLSNKHQQVALMLIKERKSLVEKLVVLQHRSNQLERALVGRAAAAGEAGRLQQLEAEMEKKMSEMDVEREQLQGRLSREEGRCRDLTQEVGRLRGQLDHHRSSGGMPMTAVPVSVSASPVGNATPRPERVVAPHGAMITGTPVAVKMAPPQAKVFKDTPPNTPPEVRKVPIVHMRDSPDRDHMMYTDGTVKRNMMYGNIANSRSPERTIPISVEKPTPAEKPEANPSLRVAGASSVFTTSTGNTTLYTSPTGTRISLNVGPATTTAVSGSPRRPPAPLGRGMPPPVPPNKPQILIPQSTAGASRRDTMSHDPVSMDTTTSLSSDASPNPTVPSNLDFFGPEMADLQQLLVSMATGSRESTPPSVDSHKLSPSSPTAKSDTHLPPLHQIALTASLPQLQDLLANQDTQLDLNQPITDGTTPAHLAAEAGNHDVLEHLLDQGATSNSLRDDKVTPLHVAAGEGHLRCLEILLEHDGNVHLADQSGWTSLHWSATNGHSECCRLLLSHGARIDNLNNASWTPLHTAIHGGHPDCLQQLLTFDPSLVVRPAAPTVRPQSYVSLVDDVVDLVDKDGWTVAHLAAIRDTKDCLEVLVRHCSLDLVRTDKWNRTVMEVASSACREFLAGIGNENEKLCTVRIDLPPDSQTTSNRSLESQYVIGNLIVTTETGWSELEEKLSNVLINHLNDLTVGMHTKRTTRLDTDSPDGTAAFSLGISMHSIKWYSIGHHHWSPGTPCERSPFEMLGRLDTRVIAISMFNVDDSCQDALACETLLPVATLQNYLRVIEQYKNVVFYGPNGTGKTYLARKLAHCVQAKENLSGKLSSIHFVSMTSSFTHLDLVSVMLEKECLLPTSMPVPTRPCPILILDDISKVDVADVFKDILLTVDNRGPAGTIRVHTGESGEVLQNVYLSPHCYILATMDRTCSTGLELSVQQHFRWVQLRNDQEPTRHLLHRHLWRRLVHRHGGRVPPGDSHVYRAVEWVICVWQRLNEGLSKLGLMDIAFGPSHFLMCPIEENKPKSVLRWLSLLWNHVVAPTVMRAVIRGSGTETSASGQQKVANTALYVLMQRAVVSGCPLSGQEKERYLSSFHGSNELDIKMRSDKKEGKAVAIVSASQNVANTDVTDGTCSATELDSEDETSIILSSVKDSTPPRGSMIVEQCTLMVRTPPEGAASIDIVQSPDGSTRELVGPTDTGPVSPAPRPSDFTPLHNGSPAKPHSDYGIKITRPSPERITIIGSPEHVRITAPAELKHSPEHSNGRSETDQEVDNSEENFSQSDYLDGLLNENSVPPRGQQMEGGYLSDDDQSKMFALSGFPVSRPIVPQRSSSLQNSLLRSPRTVSKYGVPVIVTQPSGVAPLGPPISPFASSSAAMNSARFNEIMSRSFDGELPGFQNRGLPVVDVKRALSPQPEGPSRPWSPGPDPRRSLSPGPDMVKPGWGSNRERFMQRQNGAEVVQSGFNASPFLGSRLSPAPKFRPPMVVNPTKLPPFTATGTLGPQKTS